MSTPKQNPKDNDIKKLTKAGQTLNNDKKKIVVKPPVNKAQPVPAKKPTPAPKQEEKKPEPQDFKFLVGRVHVTRWKLNPYGVFEREVSAIEVNAAEDMANRPTEGDAMIEDALEKAHERDGWCRTDCEAMREVMFMLQETVDTMAHDVEYNRDECVCRDCTAEFMRDIASSLRNVRHFMNARADLVSKLAKVPDIIPALEELHKFEVVNGALKLKKPKIEVQTIPISKEKKQAIEKIIDEIRKDQGDTK